MPRRPTADDRSLTVGQVAARSGITASALRFYEQEGLISSTRTAGNQRRFRRDTLRRLALIRIAQRVGIPLADIARALDTLPRDGAPDQDDWQRLSAAWRSELDERIRLLQQLRDDFTQCIGCGCLSIRRCALANPSDALARRGPGPQLLVRREGTGE